MSRIDVVPVEILAESISYIPNKLRLLCALVCTKWKKACSMATPFNGTNIVNPSVMILACKFGYATIVQRAMERHVTPFLHIQRTTRCRNDIFEDKPRLSRENRKTIRRVQQNLQAWASWAAVGGQMEIVQILVDHGLKCVQGITEHASDQLETLKWFHENGFPIDPGCWMYTHDVNVLEFLYEKEVPYDAKALHSHCDLFRTLRPVSYTNWFKKHHMY